MNGIIDVRTNNLNTYSRAVVAAGSVTSTGGTDMDSLTYKYCCQCGETKPVSEFYKNRSKRDGLDSYCKKCNKENQKAYKAADPNFQEKAYIRIRKWINENKERFDETSRKWRERNPERVHKIKRKYHEANREKVVAVTKNWFEAHPEKRREYNQNRLAYKRGGEGKITAQEWEDLKAKYGNRCIVPGCTNTDVTMDHVVPLSMGGTHTIDNIQPLCGHHNYTKNTKVIDYR